jgi:hypothetical protein
MGRDRGRDVVTWKKRDGIAFGFELYCHARAPRDVVDCSQVLVLCVCGCVCVRERERERER